MTSTTIANRLLEFDNVASHSIEFQGAGLVLSIIDQEGVKTLVRLLPNKQQDLLSTSQKPIEMAPQLPEIKSSQKQFKPARKPQTKLTEENVNYIRDRWQTMVDVTGNKAEVARTFGRMFNTAPTNIYAIVEGRSWKKQLENAKEVK